MTGFLHFLFTMIIIMSIVLGSSIVILLSTVKQEYKNKKSNDEAK